MAEDVISKIRYVTGNALYQYQDTRIALNNMIRSILYRKNENIGMGEEIEDGETKENLSSYSDEEITELIKDLHEEGELEDNEVEYIEELRELASKSEKHEKMYENLLNTMIEDEPAYYLWLEKIKGISTRLASALLKEYSYCETYDTVSQLWSHSGLDPEGAKGREKGEQINYDPDKKKLAWKVMDSFVKQRTEPYRSVYDNEKERQKRKKELKENGREDEYNGSAPESKKHIDLRARRKAVKVFLQHYWVITRQLKGYSTVPPYVHDKLKHGNYIKPTHIPDKLKPFDPIREGE